MLVYKYILGIEILRTKASIYINFIDKMLKLLYLLWLLTLAYIGILFCSSFAILKMNLEKSFKTFLKMWVNIPYYLCISFSLTAISEVAKYTLRLDLVNMVVRSLLFTKSSLDKEYNMKKAAGVCSLNQVFH